MTQIALESTMVADLVQNGDVESGPSRTSKLTGRITKTVNQVRSIQYIGTYSGVLLLAAGAILLAVAWGKVAGLTNVALQLPYVVSAGFTGLGLVAAGLTVVNICAKQADARERTRQVTELRALLTELRNVVESDSKR